MWLGGTIPDRFRQLARRVWDRCADLHTNEDDKCDEIAAAILEERKRCIAIANDRVAVLAKSQSTMPNETFGAMMVEAMLIEQRLTQNFEPKDSIIVRGYHDQPGMMEVR